MKKLFPHFHCFLPHYNGVTYYDQSYCHSEVHLDACLTGLGGAYGSMVYALPIPKGHLNYNIAHLEILNIIVALKVWAAHWANRRIRIHCDNMAVVEVLSSGRARDPTLALIALIRNIWLICAIFHIHIAVVHIPGKNNVLADLLSRWQFTADNCKDLAHILPQHSWVPTHLDLTLLNHIIQQNSSFVDDMENAAQLATSAVDKLMSGFRPSTLRQYRRMWSDFIAFQVAAGLLSYQVNVHLLLAFLEYLNHNGIASSQLQNHLPAIRALHILHGLNTSAFRDERLCLFVKALKIHLDVPLLECIIKQCDNLEFPVVFKPLYLVVFFSFLRLSNVLPHSVASFDHTRQLARGDVIFGDLGAVLLLKWSKRMQNRK